MQRFAIKTYANLNFDTWLIIFDCWREQRYIKTDYSRKFENLVILHHLYQPLSFLH
jgi:hypothetical protein